MACLSHSASQTKPMAESTRPFLFNRVQLQVLVRFSLDSPSYLSVSDVLTSHHSFGSLLSLPSYSVLSETLQSPLIMKIVFFNFFFVVIWILEWLWNTRRVPRLVTARAHIMWEIALTHATCLWFLCPAVSH